eukprot:8176326-Alexandrium_andersonii.AAC.1
MQVQAGHTAPAAPPAARRRGPRGGAAPAARQLKRARKPGLGNILGTSLSLSPARASNPQTSTI